jgi:hypothetical protein
MNSTRSVFVPQGFSPQGGHADKLARLAAEMLAWTSMTLERREYGHYVDVHSRYWRAMFGGMASKVVLAAKECGLIESGRSYSPGRFAKGYRLTSRYRSGEHAQWTITSVVRSRGNRGKRHGDLDNVEQTLLDRMRLVRLGDVSECTGWVGTQVALIHSGQLRANRCQYGRLHTSYGCLPRVIRRSLVGRDGQELTSLDIRSCQPLLIGYLALGSISQSGGGHTTMLHIARSRGGIGDYLDLCQCGQLYEFIVDRLRAGDVTSRPREITATLNGREVTWVSDPSRWSRDQAKDSVQVCMFGDLPTMQQTPAYQVIRRYWPGIADYLTRSKSEGRYQAVAEQCQRLESRLMIDGVAMEFARRHPDKPIVTIHDELMVPVDLAGEAEALIGEVWGRIGLRPKV